MSYFIAIVTAISGRKPINRTLYPTKAEAEAVADQYRSHYPSYRFVAMDADHDPGKTILRYRREF